MVSASKPKKGLLKFPAMQMFPSESILMEVPSSAYIPPADFTHNTFPDESVFKTNMSLLFATEDKLNAPIPGSKCHVPVKTPVTNKSDNESTTIELTSPKSIPFKASTQTK